MQHHSYLKKRGQLEQYFDRTAFDAWAKLTSTAPVSGIRKTVRAGRDEMRNVLLAYLPSDLSDNVSWMLVVEQGPLLWN